MDLPEGPYDVILADPPWTYGIGKSSGFSGVADAQYRTMKPADLRAMPVQDVAAPDAVLLMWATWPKLEEAFPLIDAWGFTYKTGLPWVKTTADLKRPRLGLGFWIRGCSEILLVSTRGNPGAPPKENRQLGILIDRSQRHSQKPDGVYDFAETISAHVGDRRLELFARRPRAGWEQHGNDPALVADPVARGLLS